MRKKVGVWMWVLVGFGTLGAVVTALIAIPGRRTTGRASNESLALSCLRALKSAQDDFRANDRDGDGRREYWRKDVAGLYALVPRASDEPLRLIERSIAAADAAPLVNIAAFIAPGPKAGYLYRCLRFVDEDPTRPDAHRFAVQAYPADPASGRTMFILDHFGETWRKAAVAGGIDVFPADPAADEWIPVR